MRSFKLAAAVITLLLVSQHAIVRAQDNSAEEEQKKKAMMGAAALLGTLAVTAVAVKKFDEKAEAAGTPTVKEYITAKKVDAPATYVTSIDSPYCFPQSMSKIAVAPLCPKGFLLDTQSNKCFAVTGYACPKGSSPMKADRSMCQKCIGLKTKCIKYQVEQAQPKIQFTEAICPNNFAPVNGACGVGCPLSSVESKLGKCEQTCPYGFSECKLAVFRVCVANGANQWGADSCDLAKSMILKLDKDNVCTVAGPVPVIKPTTKPAVATKPAVTTTRATATATATARAGGK